MFYNDLNSTYLDKIESFFKLNYIANIMVENCLYLMTFAMVNLYAVTDFTNLDEFMSLIVSATLLATILALMSFLVIKLWRAKDFKDLYLGDLRYVKSMFEVMKNDRASQLYWPIFILRRFAFSLVIVLLKDYISM